MVALVLPARRQGGLTPRGGAAPQRAGRVDRALAALEAAAAAGVALELNCQIERLDLNEHHARLARDRGVTIIIDSDAHSPPALGLLRWGAAIARRAWLEPGDVLNTRPVEEFRSSLRRNRSKRPRGRKR